MSSQLDESAALHARVAGLIAEGGPRSASELDGLALDVARYQVDHVEPVARLARARGVDPRRLASIDAFPALPTDVFRLRRVAAHPAALDTRVFRTSGTTEGAAQRGAHPFRTLATYEAAALAWGRVMLLGDPPPERALVLGPPAHEAPESSLAFMIDLFVAELAIPCAHLVSMQGGLDVDGLLRAASEARDQGARTAVFGTSFAYVHVLDADLGAALELPAGSLAMLTGGFKGRTREVGETELRAEVARAFGLAPTRIIGEYGMTELSSQLYEPRLARVTARAGSPGAPPSAITDGTYAAPPWVRVSAVDPLTLEPVPPGEEGIARFVDLANVDSAVAVQTMDRVRALPDGTVQLLGRTKGAPPRGCSLAIEEILGNQGP